jgi:hypothetical protein
VTGVALVGLLLNLVPLLNRNRATVVHGERP